MQFSIEFPHPKIKCFIVLQTMATSISKVPLESENEKASKPSRKYFNEIKSLIWRFFFANLKFFLLDFNKKKKRKVTFHIVKNLVTASIRSLQYPEKTGFYALY